MYESAFKLRGRPFSILPDPDCVYLSDSHRSAMVLLDHACTHRTGYVVITGGVGTGKTTLLRSMMRRQPATVWPGFVANPHPSFGPLLGRVLQAFGIETENVPPLEMLAQFELFIEQLSGSGRKALLVIDEAQALGAALLEELRLLSNIEVNGHMPQVVLAGQPLLRKTLRHPDLQQFVQRVVADYQLQPLSADETMQYIRYRLAHAGASDESIFDADCCAVVHDYSRGVPRLINIVCEDALIVAAATKRERIDADFVRALAHDRLSGGVLPLAEGGTELD